VEEVKKKKEGINVIETERTKTDYIQKGINLYVPDKTYKSLVGNPLRQIMTYAFNSIGNVQQQTSMDEVPVAFLWSYNGRYPIVEIKNATYTQVVNSVNPTLLFNISSSSNYPTYEMINTLPESLRSSFPQAEVTTYTYKPLVGMTSKTDPRGITIYYEYDDFNRLEYIKDTNGNIIQKFDYHYKE
jgi:YD repeat-containing protein